MITRPRPERFSGIAKRYREISKLPPQKRGYEFEKLIHTLLELYDLGPEAITTSREQIDLTTNAHHIFELRWRKKRCQPRDLGAFHSLLEDRPPTVRGVFISMSGFTPGAIEKGRAILQRRSIILLDGWDFESIVVGRANLLEVLSAKFRAAEDRLQVYDKGTSLGTTPTEEDDAARFSAAMGLFDRKFRYLNRVFRPPHEFASILAALRTRKFVIITGEPMTGKTFCSVNLLFQSFLEDYVPTWIRLEDLERPELDVYNYDRWFGVPRRAIYFEDPFGKIEFTGVKGMFRDLDRIAQLANQNDVRVVISSRHRAFVEALRKQDTQSTFAPGLDWFSLSLASYTPDDLEGMVRGYVDLYRPRWAQTSAILDEVANYASHVLSVPFSIERFVVRSLNLEALTDLRGEIDKSIDLKAQLEAEFRSMTRNERLFLYLLVLVAPMEKSRVQTLFERLSSYSTELALPEVDPSELWAQSLFKFGERIREYEEDLHHYRERARPAFVKRFTGVSTRGADRDPSALAPGPIVIDFVHPIYHEVVKVSLGRGGDVEFFAKLFRTLVSLGEDDIVTLASRFLVDDELRISKSLWNNLVGQCWREADKRGSSLLMLAVAETILARYPAIDDRALDDVRAAVQRGRIPAGWKLGVLVRTHLARFPTARTTTFLRELQVIGDDYLRLGVAICLMEMLPAAKKDARELLADLVLDTSNSLHNVLVFSLLNGYSSRAPKEWLDLIIDRLSVSDIEAIASLARSRRASAPSA